ncbi:TetR family transcriptional regulator [Rathayibacter sp. VKM Ac-2803]|uniref:TetR/AcrR family transcriptional regulator n=1 Tax=unclassified Rathayibacter TaxID=2609250 RepID=UPI0013588A74|nr:MULTISPECIES: TetR/AcrR family transcriptional regulator [unclassified Rathayibacter]MWV50723.1 TetR family transcriptional regulator [Rathayibacter sp. VKM Ac-2803]MWV60765.1 TetR family transcriptional regulator [Rathayibacter sp. VKM Ac-2754]
MEQTEPARTRGPYAKTAQRRREIIDAATTVFAARGYHGGSLRDIARQLDLSLTSVVHHFGSKYILLEAVLERANETGLASFESDCREHGLVIASMRLVRFNLQRPELLRILAMLAAEASSADHPAHQWFVDRYSATIAAWVEALRFDQEQGRVDPSRDVEVLAEILVGMWDGLQLQWLIDPSRDMERAMASFFAAMLPEAPSEDPA